MAVNPANMESCFPKSRCLSGANEGVAYDRDSPCGGIANVVFNPVACDCEETLFCADSEECGYDVDYEIADGANTLWSMKPCQASVCTIICESDEYRQCRTYESSSGSFYLAPNRCLRKLINYSDGPCPNESPAPSDAYIEQHWYTCAPDVETPSYANCGTPVAQMPGGGYCSTVMTGPGIVEAGRVQRVKKVTSITVSTSIGTGGYAGCYTPNCAAPTGFVESDSIYNLPVPCEDSFGFVRYNHISTDCGGSAPGTWAAALGTDWVQFASNIEDASSVTAQNGASDAVFVTVTFAKSSGSYQKGDTLAILVGSSWSGAIGCTFSVNTATAVARTTSCYKPSELV